MPIMLSWSRKESLAGKVADFSMTFWKGCEIPDDLYFDVDQDVWIRLEQDGQVTIGMTDPAQARCGKIVHMHFKKVGKRLEQGKSVVTVESAKWAGPVPTPVSGTVTANNEDAFREDILIANRDPYGAGWMARIQPENWKQESAVLLKGEAALESYKARIEEMGITCFRCAD